MQQNPPIPDDPLAVPLPHNFEAEQAVLGAVLLQEDAIDGIMNRLVPEDFYSTAHIRIYTAMIELVQSGKPIDLVLLLERLQVRGWIDEVGGVSYLAQLSGAIPSTALVGHYINIVTEKSVQRKLMGVAKGLYQSSQETEDVTRTVLQTQSKLEQLIEGATERKSFRSIGDIAKDCIDETEHRYNNRDGTGITGIPSGFEDLDRMTGGFQNTDMIVIGARPSVGKTNFAKDLVRNAAALTGKTIAFFSLEMSEKQIVYRHITSEANLDATRLRSGHLLSEDWERLANAIGKISEYDIVIDDTPGLMIHEIRSKCRKLKRERNLGMIVIDYLQLIETVRRSGVNRQQEITEISRSLKQMAKELDVPVIVLSQLSRGVEQRQDKRPVMSDLRESGAVEQDADLILLLYRDDYYNQESERKNRIEVILAKQRNGPIGTVELVSLKQFNKFVNLDSGNGQSNGMPPTGTEGYKKPDMYR